MILWATIAMASTTHPCAGPIEAARRTADPIPALLAMDDDCETSAWHDAMGLAWQRAGHANLAGWHFAQCAAFEDHLQDVCLVNLARAAQQSGATLDLRELVIDVAPDALRAEERDYLLLHQGFARLEADRSHDARASFEAVQSRSTWSLHARLARARLAEDEGRRGDALELYTGLLSELDETWGALRDEARIGSARLLAGVGRHEEAVGILAGVDLDEAHMLSARSWLALDQQRPARAALGALEAWYPAGDALRLNSYCERRRWTVLRKRIETDLAARYEALVPILRNATPSSAWGTWRADRWGLDAPLVLRIGGDRAVAAAFAALDTLDPEIETAGSDHQEVREHVERTLTSERRRRESHAGRRLHDALAALVAEVDGALRDVRDPGVCP